MKITLTETQFQTFMDFLSACEDCEALSEKEYVIDLYDAEPPVSMDITLGKNILFVDGAAELIFSEEMDGWYIGRRIENTGKIMELLCAAGAIKR
ncbi:MAG: hypothetical protein U0L09_09935 [Christensenellales bacterium]|nr:hypothetical protein [Christensenellales bacterium]